jgi:Rrf2 family protein
MKISAQEEYGLRLLIRIAKNAEGENMNISTLSQLEGLSAAYVGKLTGVLRKAGFIYSNPGNIGGYILSRPAIDILIKDVLKSLGGSMFDKEFCGIYSGTTKFCTHSSDCSVRSLWRIIQLSIDRVLDNITLADLTGTEEKSSRTLMSYL